MANLSTITLATRTSDLAQRQAEIVKNELERRRYTVHLEGVSTTGDEIKDSLIHELGSKGAFVRDLDQQVLSGDADCAIHSLKDVPTEQPDDLTIAAVPERGPPEDVLITPQGNTLDEMPAGAIIGTSSLRRQAQVRAATKDIELQPLRGNIDTRIEKLLAPYLQQKHQQLLDDQEDQAQAWFENLSMVEQEALSREVETELDGIILARSGLERSGLAADIEFQPLPKDKFTPAPGQGALAITACDDEVITEVKRALDHPRTRVETTIERTILKELGGGCIAPIGIHAYLKGDVIHVTAVILDQSGDTELRVRKDIDVDRYESESLDIADELADKGGKQLIERAKQQ